MNNKASGSTILGITLFALILLTSFSYIAIYSRTLTQQGREALIEEYKVLKKSLNVRVSFTLSEEGLYINVDKPPLKLIEVVAVGNDGTTTYLNRKALINTTKYLLIDNASLKNLLTTFDKLLVLTDVDLYVLSNEYIKSLSTSSSNIVEGLHEITPYLTFKPYLIVGALKTQRDAFLANPIPGSLSDVEATYVPIAVVELNKSALNVVKSSGDGYGWYVGHYGRGTPSPGTGSGDPTYVMGWLKYEYQPAFKINTTHWIEQLYASGLYPVNYYYWYIGTAGIYLIPVIAYFKTSSSVSFYFAISKALGPMLYVKPVIFAVTLESFLKSKIPVKASALMTEPMLKYGISRAPYTWFGVTYTVSQSVSFTVRADPQTIYAYFPGYTGPLVILVGFTFVCGGVDTYNHRGNPTVFNVLNIPLNTAVDLNDVNLSLVLGLTSTDIYPLIQGLPSYKLLNLNNNPRYLGVINTSSTKSFKVTYVSGITALLPNFTLNTLYDSNPINTYRSSNVIEVTPIINTYAFYDIQHLTLFNKNFYVRAWSSYNSGSNDNPNQWWLVEFSYLDPDTSTYVYVELRDSTDYIITTKTYVLNGSGSVSDTFVYSGLNFAYYYYIRLSFNATSKKLILKGGVYTASGYAYGSFRCYVYLGKNLPKLFDNGLFTTYSYEAKNFKVAVIDLNVVNIALLKPNTFVLT